MIYVKADAMVSRPEAALRWSPRVPADREGIQGADCDHLAVQLQFPGGSLKLAKK